MRLFLGVTFIYAGLQKLTDPQFFNPAAPGYIGRQIIAFAHGSPLDGFLMAVAVPYAHVFGLLVAYGELAIGIGTMLGFLLRPAAFFGLLLSFMFFLSASWHVYPYFYGADIVFVFCWLTLLMAGAGRTGLPALDGVWVQSLLSPEDQVRLAPAFSFLLGVNPVMAVEEATVDVTQTQQDRRSAGAARPGYPQGTRPTQQPRPKQQSRYVQERIAFESRRKFIQGALVGGGGVLGLGVIWNLLGALRGSDDAGPAVAPPASSVTGTAPATSATAGAGTGATLAQVNSVQKNSSVNFTIASNGDPGILVRTKNGDFVAYDATCTHAGCPVSYDPTSQLLICPCHGAEFDPAKAASVVAGPAPTPLAPVSINVDSKSGAITTRQ